MLGLVVVVRLGEFWGFGGGGLVVGFVCGLGSKVFALFLFFYFFWLGFWIGVWCEVFCFFNYLQNSLVVC